MFDGKMDNDKLKARIGDVALFFIIVIATAANFTEFGFTFTGLNKITAVSVLIYMVTTITYNHTFNRGKLEGKLDETYVATMAEYSAERDSLLDGNRIDRIEEFLEDYVKRELVEYRKGLLMQYDISYGVYASKYLKATFGQIMREKISFRAKLAILKCNRAKPARLQKADIVSYDDNGMKRKRPIGRSGHKSENLDKFRNAGKRLIITLFSGTVGVDLVFNFSWVALVQWAIRMSPIFFALITGQAHGYKNIAETENAYRKNQIYMIRLCKEWIDKNPKKEVADDATSS